MLIPLCNRHNFSSILFTLRSETVGSHKGQVSFPGGHVNPNESVVEAAIRETYEELGDGVGEIEILGVCQTIPAVTGTLVTPVLGFIKDDIEDMGNLSPNPSEVARIFTRSVDVDLLTPGYRTFEVLSRNNISMTLPAFGPDNDEKIWGLTAVILNSVLDRVIIPTKHSLDNE